MTKNSEARQKRGSRKTPRSPDVAGIVMMMGKAVFITNDMLTKQLHRDGPKVARSFDTLAREHITECSRIFARCQTHLIPYLPQRDETGFKVTAARLLFSALNAYVASIEVARHGYPRQYGASARLVIETVSVVLDLTTEPKSLERFHAGNYNSTKSIAAGKKCLPLIGTFYGMLSNDFVHIGPGHVAMEGPKLYKPGDETIAFIAITMRALIMIIHIVADLIFGQDAGEKMYWKEAGEGWAFDPDSHVLAWMDAFLLKTSEA